MPRKCIGREQLDVIIDSLDYYEKFIRRGSIVYGKESETIEDTIKMVRKIKKSIRNIKEDSIDKLGEVKICWGD